MANFLIVANGQFLAKELIVEAARNKIIIALDGAAEKLRQMNIVPHVILGDFDSLSEEQMQYWGIKSLTDEHEPYSGKEGVLIVPAYDQTYSDLEKAIHYCDQQRASSITIVCATAGRLDHHEHAMHILADYYRPDRSMWLHTDQQTLRYARDEEVVIHGQPGDKCGINAKHTGRVSSQGLKYECHHAEVSFCNELSGKTATLTITGGALLIVPLRI